MEALRDSHGRQFRYLRLSVTEACNFKCSYCLPHGYKKSTDLKPLSLQEIRNLVEGFAELGVSKIRLTGGEHTLRKDLSAIISEISKVSGIKKIALTTNGYRLKSSIKDFRAAGLTSLNVSIDSLNPENFFRITGRDQLTEILAGLDLAMSLGFESIKVNTVLLKDYNYHELSEFLDFVKTRALSWRFIELMKTGDNVEYFKKQHLSAEVLVRELYRRGWESMERSFDSGPATEFQSSNSLGKVGVIAPYSKDFCEGCNRLRVSNQGDSRLCLFGEGKHSLREWLQSPSQKTELIHQILTSLRLKEEGHQLHQWNSGSTRHLAEIGG